MSKTEKAKLLDAAIDTANRRNRGKLSEGSSIIVDDIVAYLKWYLFEERGFSEARVRNLQRVAMPPPYKGKWETSPIVPELEDEGIRLAIGLLNSVESAQRLENPEHVKVLFSGEDGLRGAKVRKGGARRGIDIRQQQQQAYARMQTMINETARRYPAWTFRKLAEHVAKACHCDERTVRRHTKKPPPIAKRGTTS